MEDGEQRTDHAISWNPTLSVDHHINREWKELKIVCGLRVE